MKAVEVINKALPIFLQYRNLECEYLLDIFIKKGFDPDTARKIVVLMPIAFGRPIMNELGAETSSEFDVYEKKGSSLHKQRRKLNNVEIYREAFKIASGMAGNEDETFWAVANRSAELSAVRHLKSQGGEPQGMVLTAIETMWEIEEESPYTNPETIESENTEPSQSKNWWEFWK